MPSVLVTGAGRGIGLAITERMSRRGWNVSTARSDAALTASTACPMFTRSRSTSPTGPRLQHFPISFPLS